MITQYTKRVIKIIIQSGFVLCLGMAYFVHAGDNDYQMCNALPSFDFTVSVTNVEDDQIVSDQLPLRTTNNGKEFAYQDRSDNVIINITKQAKQGYIREKEYIQILDDTGLFISYLSGLDLVGAANWVSPNDFNNYADKLEEYLDKLSDTIDDLDPSWFVTNDAEESLEEIFTILDERPIDRRALFKRLNDVTYFTSNYFTRTGNASISGYYRTRVEGEPWGQWRNYSGPNLWRTFRVIAHATTGEIELLHWRTAPLYGRKNYQISSVDQFFVASVEHARLDKTENYICTSQLAQSYIKSTTGGFFRNTTDSRKGYLASVRNFFSSGGNDSDGNDNRVVRRGTISESDFIK